MSVYDDVLLAVVNLAQETQPYSTIAIGSMPPENGISMAYSSGSLETYLSKKAAVTMSVVLNGKQSTNRSGHTGKNPYLSEHAEHVSAGK